MGKWVGELSAKGLQATLRSTTERLAAELEAPRGSAPGWSTAEWRMAPAVATMHGIAPLLAVHLRWAGPESWREYLSEQCELASRRHDRICELLRLLDAGLRAAGIGAVALKGVALYEAGLYRAGQRPMADVDVLVRQCDLEPASRVLERLGFAESLRLWKNRLFTSAADVGRWCPQHPRDHPIKVELHERVCEMLPLKVIDITAAVCPTRPAAGLRPYPGHAALMAHLLLHAAGSIVDRALRLIQLHDIALLAARMTAEDWTRTLAAGADPPHALWWAYPPLQLTARYYPERIPRSALDTARASCPWALRRISERQRLSEVSLSFPWIEAFPGIAWTRSPREALEYIGSRVVRGREQTSMRELASRTEPGLSAGERRWLGTSQAGRILRWLLSHPARPLTMRAVRSAFGEP
jgi:hypothetical protein